VIIGDQRMIEMRCVEKEAGATPLVLHLPQFPTFGSRVCNTGRHSLNAAGVLETPSKNTSTRPQRLKVKNDKRVKWHKTMSIMDISLPL
jgi:hypothetical protein